MNEMNEQWMKDWLNEDPIWFHIIITNRESFN